MSINVNAIDIRPKVRIKSVALPIEHGSWGFLLEPLVASLAIAFSSGGVFIAVAVTGLFLSRQPFSVLAAQWQQRGRPATTAAFQFLTLYGLIALIGFAGALLTVGPASLAPLVIAAPVAAFQLYTEITVRGRQVAAELAGAMIMPSSAAAIVLANGGTWTAAGVIWFFFAARFVPSILYVRNRLNLEKNKRSSFLVPTTAHLIALIGVGYLAIAGNLPLLTMPAFALLLARSAIGLSPYRRRVKAMKIGIWEVIYGTIVVASLVVGHFAAL